MLISVLLPVFFVTLIELKEMEKLVSEVFNIVIFDINYFFDNNLYIEVV